MRALGCDFCDEFAGGAQNRFAALYQGDVRSRALLDVGNFRVFPSIGQIVEGYLLIAPLDHYARLSEMPADLVNEISDLDEFVRSGVSAVYGECLTYEHGASRESGRGCGVYHAHLHIVPLPAGLDPVNQLMAELPFEEVRGLSDAKQRVKDRPYLYYEDLTRRRYLFDADTLPSQYVRRLLARSLGRAEWDWRGCGKEGELLATVARLSEHFNLGKPRVDPAP